MTLSDRDIKKSINEGRIKINPSPNFDEQLGSCSIDLKLGNQFKIFKSHTDEIVIDIREKGQVENLMEDIFIENDKPLILRPQDLVIATTAEWLEISNDLIGRIEGRSSLGRLGIIVHGTASVFDPGWKGKPVLELVNLGVIPVLLYPGMRICSFTFEELSSPSEVPYCVKKNNKYSGQHDAIESKLSQEF